MNGSGLGALIQGFQQGYSFVDDIERKKKNDARLDKDDARADRSEARIDKTFARQEKKWSKEDEWAAQDQADAEEFGFGKPKQESVVRPLASAGVAPSIATPEGGAPTLSGPVPGGAAMAPAAQMAGTGIPAAPKPQANQYGNLNTMMGFAQRKAIRDVERGQKDGASLLAVQKILDGMKKEGMDEAVKLLHQGRVDEAVAKFDASGDNKFGKIVGVQDGVFKAGKTDMPTKIVTVQGPDGSLRTLNTAQTLYQQQDMAKLVESAQKDRKIDIDEQHGKDMVAESARGHNLSHRAAMAQVGVSQQRLGMEKESFKRQSLDGQIQQLEAVTGPLEPEERKKLGMRLAGLGKGEDSMGKFADEIVKEGVKAGTIKPQDAVTERAKLIESVSRGRDEGIIANTLIDAKEDPAKYAEQYAKAVKVLPEPRLKELGFLPPKPVKPPKAGTAGALATVGVAPYLPPPDSMAGKAIAQRTQLASQQAMELQQLRGSFDADASTLPAVDLVRKYDTVRRKLAPQQLQQLIQAERAL